LLLHRSYSKNASNYDASKYCLPGLTTALLFTALLLVTLPITVRAPATIVLITLELGRVFQRLPVNVDASDRITVLVLRQLDSIPAQRDVTLANAEETANTDHQTDNVTLLIQQQIGNLTDFFILLILHGAADEVVCAELIHLLALDDCAIAGQAFTLHAGHAFALLTFPLGGGAIILTVLLTLRRTWLALLLCCTWLCLLSLLRGARLCRLTSALLRGSHTRHEHQRK
jgi:hypothetical protein